jgi:MFS family permease
VSPSGAPPDGSTGPGGVPGKARNLTLLSVACLLAMALWFSASAVVPQLAAAWALSPGRQAWLTMSVQAGFVAGALISATLNLADRIPAPRLFAACALAGAAVNAAIPNGSFGPDGAVALRFLTGAALAGVYPPGMKIAATWSLKDRGFAIGVLVGALTFGSALPHLLNALPEDGAGMPPWRGVLLVASALAAAAGVVVAIFVEEGPHRAAAAPFDWRLAGRVVADRPVRLANLGYLGHMWELYAMWTWTPLFLLAAYEAAGWSGRAARAAGFAVIAAGAAGCVVAGLLADRIGRTAVTMASLALSGGCCLAAGALFDAPGALTALCLVWGFAVVADSAQFSAAVSELSDPRHVGTALTVQTCLGFLLTMFTIRIVPALVETVGWRRVFLVLAAGPAVGIFSMARLRALPEASRLASGRR